MRLKKSLSNLSHQVATLLLAGAVAAPSWAERIRFVSVIAPTAEAKLVFADGSNRTLSLVQREGMTSGAGPLASAIMQEWGMHDIVRPKVVRTVPDILSSLWQMGIRLI